jgi:hypothetical protein
VIDPTKLDTISLIIELETMYGTSPEYMMRMAKEAADRLRKALSPRTAAAAPAVDAAPVGDAKAQLSADDVRRALDMGAYLNAAELERGDGCVLMRDRDNGGYSICDGGGGLLLNTQDFTEAYRRFMVKGRLTSWNKHGRYVPSGDTTPIMLAAEAHEEFMTEAHAELELLPRAVQTWAKAVLGAIEHLTDYSYQLHRAKENAK